MKVTLITVCRNAEPVIKVTLDSILAQKHLDIESIVIDGVSTEGSMAVLEQYRPRGTQVDGRRLELR
ncbi:MAG: glycosyltransferase [Planctomycetota bacterium]